MRTNRKMVDIIRKTLSGDLHGKNSLKKLSDLLFISMLREMKNLIGFTFTFTFSDFSV